MIAKLLILTLRDMVRQLRRTVLTSLMFSVAAFICAILVAVPWSMDRIAANASKGLRLVVTERNNNRLPARYCEEIRKIPHVLGCAPYVIWEATYRDPKSPIVAYGVTPDIAEMAAPTDYRMPPELSKNLPLDRRYALVGVELMRENHWKVGQQITLRDVRDPRMTLTFIPFFEYPNEYMSHSFLFDRRLLDEAVKSLYGTDLRDSAAFLMVRIDQADNMGTVANAIDDHFRNADAETETTTESNSLVSVVTAIGSLRAIIYSLCVVVLVTVLLIAANSMAMTVRDRTSEVAVMRALGFARHHIALLLFAEAVLIALCGGVGGAILALFFFAHGVRLGEVTGMLGYVEVRGNTAAIIVATGVMVSIASAALPVVGAIRVLPVDAFRKPV